MTEFLLVLISALIMLGSLAFLGWLAAQGVNRD
jgi:hypothetical protein